MRVGYIAVQQFEAIGKGPASARGSRDGFDADRRAEVVNLRRLCGLFLIISPRGDSMLRLLRNLIVLRQIWRLFRRGR